MSVFLSILQSEIVEYDLGFKYSNSLSSKMGDVY